MNWFMPFFVLCSVNRFRPERHLLHGILWVNRNNANRMLERELMEIGLNEKEVKVYLASLELGQSAVQAIANKSGVNRATTYFVIEGLTTKGLISSFYEGKKQFFIATDPDRLVEILEEQERDMKRKSEELKKLIPQLQSINNKKSDRPVVRYYDGKEGVKTLFTEFLRGEQGSEAYMAYSVDAIDRYFQDEEIVSFRNMRISKGVKTKSVYTYKNGSRESTSESQRRKIPADKFPISCDIAVYKGKIRFVSLGDHLSGIAIEDKDIALSLRSIFELAWEGAEKYQEKE
jgi:HTH-type transcriptional regulator, sugar sensing transcriptional regulator